MTPNPQSKLKTYGTIAIVIAVILIAYFYVSGGSSASDSTLVSGTPYGTVGASELALLNQVKSLNIDTALFSDPSFLSLTDYSVAIPPQNVGVRPNPFAPLGGASPAPVAASSTNSK